MVNQNCAGALSALVEWLQKYHKSVMDAEAAALAALGSDNATYATQMRQKAQLLASMDREAQTLVEALPSAVRSAVAHKIRRFSNSARMGLELDSLFYMSALLYPDEHQQGEPDNLQLFIERLQREGDHFGENA